MRALIVSDIHGNVHALNAVLASAAGGFDAVWNLGDMVGYGAFPNEVLERLQALPHAVHVRGNHDRVICGMSSARGFNPIAAQAAAWTTAALRPANLAWLRGVQKGPLQSSARTMCAHGSPLHEDQYIATMRDAFLPLQRMETEITFFGHTHVQGGFSQGQPMQGGVWEEDRPVYRQREGLVSFAMEVPVGTRHLINPGSVGQPRDGDGRASYAIYDEALARVTFLRTPYDVAAAQAAIRAAHLPERLAERLSAGR